ncbi:MAG: PAS domain S-box protein [Cyanobacteria bacterium HKST-UBA02]|nr:PAS domain S-box protein [Cyanobacteria bacterium HKST-UBA02]
MAETERSFEKESIGIIAPMGYVLGATIKQVCFGLWYSITGSRPSPEEVRGGRARILDSVRKLQSVAERKGPHREDLLELCDCASDLSKSIDGILTVEQRKGLSHLLVLAEPAGRLDQISGRVLKELSDRRSDLQVHDTAMRRIYKNILLVSLAISVIVALSGCLAFQAIISRPLRRLADESMRLAAGEEVVPRFTSGDEIGDLYTSFCSMASSIEQSRRIERSILENTGDIICTLDETGHFRRVNQAVKLVLGYSPEELEGEELSAIVPGEQLPGVQEQLENIRERVALGSFESSLRRKSGLTIDAVWSVRWSAGERLLFCTLYDVGYERQTERLGRDLRKTIAEELKGKLVHARKDLAEIGYRVGDRKDERVSRKIARLEDNIVNLVRLLETLDLTMNAANPSMVLATQPVSSRALIDSAVSVIEGLARSKGIRIVTDVDDSMVDVDQEQIRRTLVNLISNAIKVSESGDEIRLRAAGRDRTVKFEVIDSGPGIPLSKQHLLFQRFSRITSTDSAEGKGTGLGLVSAKTIVEMHNGRIGVLSDGATGTTFWFELAAVSS